MDLELSIDPGRIESQEDLIKQLGYSFDCKQKYESISAKYYLTFENCYDVISKVHCLLDLIDNGTIKIIDHEGFDEIQDQLIETLFAINQLRPHLNKPEPKPEQTTFKKYWTKVFG